jgi:anti-sigma regulatory factor (Ser/Thr protein kinase)
VSGLERPVKEMVRAERLRRSGPVHETVPYSGPGAFVDAASELLEGARERACLVVAVGAKIDQLRAALGPAARRVSFVDLSVRGRNPARVLPAMRSFVEAHRGAPVRIVAEPLHPELSPAALTESLLGELLLNRPEVSGWNAHIKCLHDTDSLAPDALNAVSVAHPAPADAAAAAAALTNLFSAELSPPPAEARSHVTDMTTLGELRSFVRHGAELSGLGDERSDDLVYAVNEAVTNSICHGEGRAHVLLWSAGDATYCEVRDKGRIDDVLVGRIAPRPKQASGRGLWLVNQLCDLVHVRSSSRGSVVRMVVEH